MFKKLFCKHKRIHCVTNIYGDMRNDFNACSIWVCDKCGKNFLSDDLSQNCELVNFTLKGSLITVEKINGGGKND